MEFKNYSLSDVESELFAIVSTINELYEKYQKAKINNDFFQRSFKNAINDLLQINIYLKRRNSKISDIISTYEFLKEYNKAIQIINGRSSLDLIKNIKTFTKDKRLNQTLTIDSAIMYLPGITAEITTSYITLMDALKLGTVGKNMILKIFKELRDKTNRFSGFKLLNEKLTKLGKHVMKNMDLLESSKTYRDKVTDHLYDLFKEFQNMLQLEF